MKTLLAENFDKTSKFIFDFYDFDKDGHITREDIRVVLSYVSLSKNKNKQNNFDLNFNNLGSYASNQNSLSISNNYERYF